MSAVTYHLPKVAYFDWSEFADFDDPHTEAHRRFCPPQSPKADGEALHYIERIEQSVIPGPCSQRRPHPTIGA